MALFCSLIRNSLSRSMDVPLSDPALIYSDDKDEDDDRRGIVRTRRKGAAMMRGTYQWKEIGFTDCTQSCLGGKLYPLMYSQSMLVQIERRFIFF